MIIGQLQTDMKTYMRGREATKIELKTVRMAISALKNKKNRIRKRFNRNR